MDAAVRERQDGRFWDPLVRVTHWTIALAVVLNALLVEGGSQVHVWIGYVALAMLGLRLVWGFVGPEEARFSAFPPSLAAARTHIAEIRAGRHVEHRSHNPLGALMAYALWAMLVVVTVTGLAMESDPFRVDRESRYTEVAEAEESEAHEREEQEEGEGMLEEIHETAANLLLVLAALHVGGVAFESRRGRRNLVREMIGSGGQ